MPRFQNGSLKRVKRAQGEAWVLRYRTRRLTDGKWVEATPILVGSLTELRSEEAAWKKVKALNINVNQSKRRSSAPITFGELAKNYLANEIPIDCTDSSAPKDDTTATTYRRYLNRWVLPRWEKSVALVVEPLEVEQWLKELGKRHKLQNPTRAKIREVMNLLYRHGIRYGLLPRDEDSNPIKWVRQSSKSNFEPVILTLPQVLAIMENLDLRMRTLVLLDASTGLRISEMIALLWRDVDWERHCIYVRRKYVYGKYGPPKSRASKAPVPLHPILAAHLQIWRSETPYARDSNLIFPSFRLKGQKPPAANMLVSDHLRPAARKAGIEAPPRSFGFHTFRRTLASVLVGNKVDPKVVQEVLRHQGIGPTLELYAKTITANKIEAQGMFLDMLFASRPQEPEPSQQAVQLETMAMATEVLQ